jgi:ribosomal protein S18 acetylase RimI-like enzyme
MAVTMMRQELTANLSDFAEPSGHCAIRELGRADQDEVMEFLSARPIHTVFMTGLIRDNGLVSPQNRGSFYGSRNQFGQLEGVALIGHATMIEAHTENSLIGFARVARNCHNAHLIRGEQSTISTFRKYFAAAGREPRLICREHLFELKNVPPSTAGTVNLRPATMDDIEKVMAVNSSMAFEEGGISPLQRDPGGFRCRTARRIEEGRVWVLVEDNRLIFKTDVVSETPEVTYLEGVFVHPEERRKGHGLRCLTKLSSLLMGHSGSICLTVNQNNKKAIALYTKAGYQFCSHYETIYLR